MVSMEQSEKQHKKLFSQKTQHGKTCISLFHAVMTFIKLFSSCQPKKIFSFFKINKEFEIVKVREEERYRSETINTHACMIVR